MTVQWLAGALRASALRRSLCSDDLVRGPTNGFSSSLLWREIDMFTQGAIIYMTLHTAGMDSIWLDLNRS